MVEVQFNKKKFKMPERWDECTLEQISKLSPLTQWKVDEITQSEQEYAVCVLMGCGDKFWQRLELELPQWYKLKEVANFAFAEKIVEQPFPSFVHLGTEYLVFQEGFADTDAVDLAWANMQYLAFAHPEHPNTDALDELIATLCRPRRKDLLTFRESKEWDGDEREVYNGQRVKARAKELKTLPFGLKVAILQYFEAQNSLFLENYSQMLGDDGREPRYGNGMGWVTMLMSVAEKGTFGNFESVCYQNVHLIWAKCLDDTLDVKEQEKQLEAQRFKNS